MAKAIDAPLFLLGMLVDGIALRLTVDTIAHARLLAYIEFLPIGLFVALLVYWLAVRWLIESFTLRANS
jgi:hypothetical protein